MSFQEEVDGILRDEASRIVSLTLAKARKRRLTLAEARGTRRILSDIIDFWESLRVEHLESFAWLFIMEKIAPGAFPQPIEKILRPPMRCRTT